MIGHPKYTYGQKVRFQSGLLLLLFSHSDIAPFDEAMYPLLLLHS